MKTRNPHPLLALAIFWTAALLPLVCAAPAFAQKKQAKKPSHIEEPGYERGKAYVIQLSSPTEPSVAPDYDELLPRFIYGICWAGEVEDNLKFAKQMGHKYVIYPKQAGKMEAHPLSSDLYFLIQKPENALNKKLGVDLALKINGEYTPEQQKIYMQNFCLRDNRGLFPDSMATGWFNFQNGRPASFAVVPDWQQRKLIDLTIDLIVRNAKARERPSKRFLFAGFAWDEPELSSDFSCDKEAQKGHNAPITLTEWTGKDSSVPYPGTTHEYSDHREARAAFYKILKKKTRELFPNRAHIWLFEPYDIYTRCLEELEGRADAKELLEGVLVTSEGEGKALTRFADDPRIFNSGLVTRDWVGSTVPNEHGFDAVKEAAGKAGIHGSWFGWFGRFSHHLDPRNNIHQIAHWEQLARAFIGWENLNGVPLNQRKWDGKEYSSPNSRFSDEVIYSRQPKTQKLFAVFLKDSGAIPLKPGEKVESIHRVDKLFCEAGDGGADLEVVDGKIVLKKSAGPGGL